MSNCNNHESACLPRASEAFNHISFSFENIQSQELQPRKSIDQYLRLKTNESIQEKSNLPAKRSLCYRKSIRGSETDPDNDYQMQLRNDEQSLRIESLTKQYELKLAKQEEFFSLREWKLKEEIENLTHQITSLNEEVRRLRTAGKQQNTHCALCSDGQVINHLNTVLKEAEQSHRHCLDEKKEMTRKLDGTSGKLQVMQEEHQKLYQQCKALGKQVRSCNSQIHQLEQENNQLKDATQALKEAAARKESEWHAQKSSYQQCIDDFRRKIAIFERKEQENIANSKASTILATIDNNMGASFMKSKQSQRQQRNSVSKIPAQFQESEDRANTQNYLYFRKTNDFSRSTNKFGDQKGMSKIENLKWKFF